MPTYRDGIINEYNIAYAYAYKFIPDPGGLAYNQWASIQPKYYNLSAREYEGTYLGDETRTNCYGIQQYSEPYSQSSGNTTDTISTALNKEIGADYRWFKVGTINNSEWTYHTTSFKSIGNLTSSDYFLKTPTLDHSTYHFHFDYWAAVFVHQQLEYYLSAYIKPVVGNASYDSFDIIDDSGVKKVKVTATGQYGFYVLNGDEYISSSNDVAYLTTGKHWRALANGIVTDSTNVDEIHWTDYPTQYDHWDVLPVDYYFTAKSFSPSISKSGNNLIISCNAVPQNGYNIYRGNTLYTTTSNTTIEIPVEYRIGSYTWKVQAVPDSSVRNIKGKIYYYTYDDDDTLWVPDMYYIRGDAYTSSSTASVSYSTSLSTPEITSVEILSPNSVKMSWNAVTYAVSYSVKLDSGAWTNVSTNLTKTWNNLSQGTHTLYVRANYSNASFSSNSASESVTLDTLPQPYNLVFNRGGVNSGTLSWSTQYNDTSDTIYAVYDGTTKVASTNNTNYTFAGLSQGNHIFGVVQEFTPDSGYNSNKTTFTFEMTKLTSPAVITLTDLKGNVYQVPGDSSTPVVTSNGKIGIKLTYPTSDTYQGITYKLYNNTFTAVGRELPDETGDSEATSSKSMYWNTREVAYGTVGKHRIYPQAVFEADHDYDSRLVFTKDASITNQATAYVDYEINTLSSPTLVWNGNNESSRIYESYLTWLPSTAQSEMGDYPDYYIVYVIADGDVGRTPLGNIYTVLQPANTSQRLGVWVPDPQPFTDGVYGLIPQMPSNVGTTTYACCVASCSYSPWYIGTSTASETTYQIIRLAAPTNLLWDVDHWTLSWSPVLNATHYYLYDNGQDITPYPSSDDDPRGITTTSYTFDSLGAGLHRFQVTALKITTETI